MTALSLRLFLGVAVSAILVGCGESETPLDHWQSEVRGATHEFVLRADGGLREGPNELELQIERLDGGELSDGAAVTAVVRMPAMVHAEDAAEVTRLETMSFAVDGVVFAMPGTWELEVTVEEGAAVDRATFELDVP